MCTNWAGSQLPNLLPSTYASKSPCTPNYNCIAWAAGDDKNWWEPDQALDWYWPPLAARKYTVEAYIQAFNSVRYSVCRDSAVEEGCEKIALFAIPAITGLRPTHAARQLPNGNWTSKLGPCEDIEHFALESVNGPTYGSPVVFMSRGLWPTP
jgi:hypothetical protein